MDILVDVAGQKLKISTNLKSLVSGTQEFIRFVFNLGGDWDNLTTFAQFRQNGAAYNQYLDENKSAYLPTEIQPGKCTIMLYGSGGNTIATTNYVALTIDEHHLIVDAESTDISLSLYNQLVNRVDSLLAEANEAATKANSAASNADEMAEKAQNSATLADEATARAKASADSADSATSRANQAIEATNTATNKANTAANRVDESVQKAEKAAENANRSSQEAETAASAANSAADDATNSAAKATEQTEAASKATSNAQNATDAANTAAKNATDFVNSATKTMDETITNAKTATDNANSAAGRVDESISKAEAATNRANNAAQRAEDASTGDASNSTVTFETAAERAGIQSGDTLAVAFGKLSKFCDDLQPHAFVPPVDDLTTDNSTLALAASQGAIIRNQLEDMNSAIATKLASADLIESTADILANTASGKIASANAVKGLKDYTPMQPSQNYVGDLNDLPTGVYVIELSQCTNIPDYDMKNWAHIICRANYSQFAIEYVPTGTPVVMLRTYANGSWTNWRQFGNGHGFNDVWQQGTITDALSVNLYAPYAYANRTAFVASWNSGTKNLPTDCCCGVREVSWVTGPIVVVRITGYTQNSSRPAVWTNVYVNAKWLGWTRAEVAPTVLWTGSGTFNATNLTLSKNISLFSYYEVLYEVENGIGSLKSSGRIPVGNKAWLDGVNTKGLTMRRVVGKPSGTSFPLEGGGYWSAFNTTPAAYAGACCPRKILGYV